MEVVMETQLLRRYFPSCTTLLAGSVCFQQTKSSQFQRSSSSQAAKQPLPLFLLPTFVLETGICMKVEKQ